MLSENKVWEKLNYKNRRKFVLAYGLVMIFDNLGAIFNKRRFLRQPKFLNLFIIHGASTLGTLALMPPVPETPAIALPIVWGASLGTAIVISSFLNLVY